MSDSIGKGVLLLLVALLTSCGGRSASPPEADAPAVRGSYTANVQGMVELQLSDHYTRSLGRTYGFYVAPDLVVANLSAVKGAYRIRLTALETTQTYPVQGYTAYDLDRDLVLLKVGRSNKNFLKILSPDAQSDTLYTLLRPEGRLQVRKVPMGPALAEDSLGVYPLAAALAPGKPAFFEDHALAGIVQEGEEGPRVLKAQWIAELMKKQEGVQAPIGLSAKSNKVYPSHERIVAYRMVTNMGNIVFRLYDETPEYRDNFIRLVSDQFYDSLTVHRVLRGFLIQTGAADTRDAGPDEVVGWQGPGYTLPMKVVPGIFHKRGALAASKLPDAKNPRDESDGSQFYIVAGRVFLDRELDELETQKGRKFSARQREVYRTVGGAPHLDWDYTVFGEVLDGMELVDRISMLETYQTDRPVKDVRVLRMEFIYRD